MTRLAFISDVHADVHAVADALAQANRLGCRAVICAGDIVDYGLFPDETIELLRSERIPCIRGNHDRWRAADGGKGGSGADLSEQSLSFLSALPEAWNAVIDGIRVAVHHGSPRSDMEGIDPNATSLEDARRCLEWAEADVLIVGHTHQAFALTLTGGGMIANPGALLRSQEPRRTGLAYDAERAHFVPIAMPLGGTFGVLELPSCRFTVHDAADGGEIDVPRIARGLRDGRAR